MKVIVPFVVASLACCNSFVEKFESIEILQTKWIPSKAKKDSGNADSEFLFDGQWAVEEPENYNNGDYGLVVKSEAKHHAISYKFPNEINVENEPLVVQYEVKLQKGLECGGAYIKLIRKDESFESLNFNDKTPFVVMFGPDKCGSTNKVHFIIQLLNPLTNQYEEKHLSNPPAAKSDDNYNLYTLIVNTDNSYEILINTESVSKGNLLTDMTPPVNPPKEIDDPTDTKPNDWVDEAKIADPAAKKPDDWDESAPPTILDLSVEKPKNWLDNEPTEVPDPDETKPTDWDDEMDGDWEAPLIPNPKCKDAGCGEWVRPTKPNPAYKGKWTAPMIDNPQYKGVWKARQIPNPDYFENNEPHKLGTIMAVGIEIWTMQKDILFDNLYVGNSVAEAKILSDELFKPKMAAAAAKKEAELAKLKEAKAKKDSERSLLEKVHSFTAGFAEGRVVETIQSYPDVFGLAIAFVLSPFLLGFLISYLFKSSSSKAVKPEEEKTKDEGFDEDVNEEDVEEEEADEDDEAVDDEDLADEFQEKENDEANVVRKRSSKKTAK